MRVVWWAAVLAAFALAGCSGESTEGNGGGSGGSGSSRDLTGLWRFGFYVGAEDDFSTFELVQTGTAVAGSDCDTSYVAVDAGGEWVLESAVCTKSAVTGSFLDPELAMQDTWSEGEQEYTTTYEGLLSADGQSLSGTGHSTKCDCDFQFRAARQVLGQPSPELNPP